MGDERKEMELIMKSGNNAWKFYTLEKLLREIFLQEADIFAVMIETRLQSPFSQGV